MRILCVDDDPLLLQLLARCLAAHHAVLMPDAASSRTYLWTHAVQWMLTDVQMPGEDGWSLAEFVAQLYPNISIGVMSSLQRPEKLPLYVRGFLQKPFTCPQVLAMVSQ